MAVWNNSTFDAHESCARLDYWRRVVGLKATYEVGLPGYTARTEGTLWHAMMAQHYGKRLATFEVHEGGATGVCADFFAELADATEWTEEKDALRDRRDYFLRLYDAYARRYEEVDAAWEILAVEHRFLTCLGDTCPKCNTGYGDLMRRGKRVVKTCDVCGMEVEWLVGQADLIIRDQGVLRVVDHKTTGKSVSDWKLASYDESAQFTHYLYGVSRTFGEPVGHACANVVAKLKFIDERGNPFHRNNEIIRGSADFDTFVDERRAAITRMKAVSDFYGTLPSPGLAPRSPSSCRRFGLCDFYGLCWPTRPDWWAVPDELVDSFEQRPLSYVDDYAMLIEEDIR